MTLLIVGVSLPFIGGWMTGQLETSRRHRPPQPEDRVARWPGHDDKTEKATPKRRGEARETGQVARSPDLTSAGVLLAGSVRGAR